jgi:hypothetical protein
MPGGRLDPPLLMALDEVTQICPVPGPSWLADSGGKGIQIITVAHGEAQLRTRWGPNGARIIMDTSGTKIWLPGISDPDTLDTASRLCGTTAMKETRTLHAQHHDHRDDYARHPVLTPEMIRQLPDRHARPRLPRTPQAPRRRLPNQSPHASPLEDPSQGEPLVRLTAREILGIPLPPLPIQPL